MDNQNSFGSRQMFQGNWTCSQCGAAITELPFEPSGDQPLFCRDCYRQKRGNRPARQSGPRQMFQGNWTCSQCGAAITELPFEPAPDQQVFCRDCYRKNRGN